MNFLVPFDFTNVTRCALDHALEVRKKLPGRIELLHIISKESDRAAAEAQFLTLLGSIKEDAKKDLTTKVRIGDIYTDIAKEAEEGKYSMMIMGTHGAKGLQKVFGSKAIKVITSSGTPFIVTQERGPSKTIDSIVIPVDLSKESVQIIRFATGIAKAFKAKVHLVCPSESDEWLSNKIRNNIANATLLLKKEGVSHEVHPLPGKESLDKEVIAYGAKVEVDLFAVAHFSESILPQFDKFSQQMITNTLQTPVLIANANQVADVKTNYSFITV